MEFRRNLGGRARNQGRPRRGQTSLAWAGVVAAGLLALAAICFCRDLIRAEARASAADRLRVVSYDLSPRVSGCVGDCDGSGRVTVSDIIIMVNIAFGTAPATDCTAGDVNQDGSITVNEIVAAVANALGGCPPTEATPTPTPPVSVTVTPTSLPGTVFHAMLTGDQETPPTTTDATGDATFTLNPDETMLTYVVTVTGLAPDQISAAHIHVAPAGMLGPIVFSLAAGQSEASFHGTLGAADLVPGVPGVRSFADFVGRLRAGETYVDVHTLAHPGGEIRGQINYATG